MPNTLNTEQKLAISVNLHQQYLAYNDLLKAQEHLRPLEITDDIEQQLTHLLPLLTRCATLDLGHFFSLFYIDFALLNMYYLDLSRETRFAVPEICWQQLQHIEESFEPSQTVPELDGKSFETLDELLEATKPFLPSIGNGDEEYKNWDSFKKHLQSLQPAQYQIHRACGVST